eukprot:2302076-Pleurochrysis_carterae.AAC.2
MLRGELPTAALSLTPRNLDDIPPIATTTTGPGAARAALRAQVEHENKMKQESKEAMVQDYSNRIASLQATAMRRKASMKLKKLQDTHAFLMNPSVYDGVQMFKELKHKLANLHDAYDADEHEREVERIRDDLLPDNCTSQDFADKVNTLIRDHNPYVQVPYVGERLGRPIIKSAYGARGRTQGRALLREV